MQTLRARYESRLAIRELMADPGQAAALAALEDLSARLPHLARKPWFFLKPREEKRGLYLYGTVGRGKTMLMDMFFEGVDGIPKRRVHFHEFMAEVQQRLHHMREAHPDNTLDRVAEDILAEARLLCFDEFQVYNIADAMILGRLFRTLFQRGAIIVATSNTRPDDLYKDGLQRALFLPFIDIIKKRLQVILVGEGVDHRLARLKGMPVYIAPNDSRAHDQIAAMFSHLNDGAKPHREEIDVGGRNIVAPRTGHGVAWFTFTELCREPRAATDYAALCEHYHTFLLEDVPELSDDWRDPSLRFIHMIDVLYEKHANLILSAAKPLENLMLPACSLYPRFERAKSRLFEMQSEEYLRAAAKAAP
jgi:cell division protein ZapE